jgi:hypothetical protein
VTERFGGSEGLEAEGEGIVAVGALVGVGGFEVRGGVEDLDMGDAADESVE